MKSFHLVGLGGVLLGGVLMGCPSSVAERPSSGADASANGDSARDASIDVADAENPLDPDAGSSRFSKTGEVHVGWTPALETTPANGDVSAFFWAEPFDEAQGCTATDLGAGCKKTVCLGNNSQTPPARQSAGALRYTVRDVSELVPRDATNQYARSFATTTVPFATGDDVAITALGDLVPPFSTSVHVEAQARIDTPMPNADGAWVLTRIGGNVFHFLGGSGLFKLRMVFGSQSTSVECSAPASSGGLTIPASAFSSFPANTQGLVAYASTNSRTQEIVGDWSVQAFGHTTARMSDGKAIPFNVLVQ